MTTHFEQRLAEIRRQWQDIQRTAPRRAYRRRGRLSASQAARMAEMLLSGLSVAAFEIRHGDEPRAWESFSKMRDYLNDCFKYSEPPR